jgi:hypothetical protein
LGEGLLEVVKKKGWEAVRPPYDISMSVSPPGLTTQGCMGQRVSLIHVPSLSVGF